MAFNEDTRVKIPAILHLCKLGYDYVSLKTAKWDTKTNIFPDIFIESITRINPENEDIDFKRLFEDISIALEGEDLGQKFYNMLTRTSGVKLIDFNDFDNNSFNVVTELTCKNGEDEFRPDITILINGMPLAFIEVKKPNNREGILAERDRINRRFQNPKFKKFINISQLLVFSNNMEYDEESIVPIKGAFYSTISYNKAEFNCFREEEQFDYSKILRHENDDIENFILKDNHLQSIKQNPEFLTNKEINTPTNRILTSLFSLDRIKMILRYSIAYVDSETGLEKHIMRYPQLFATKSIEQKLDGGIKKGIIWHTQGSGKTALAYFNVHYLTNYYKSKHIVPKFYFIVDRIDLMDQAKREFKSRGLIVHTVNSKDDLVQDFKKGKAVDNLSGQREITVVNIQKFKDESSILKTSDYDINIQRIYFLDEVHRSYNPKGSFLANLINSDRNAIIIGLTGTPLIKNDRRSKDTFGDYIHKYYYNASIADGYTLKLIREGIETKYKFKLKEVLDEIKILEGDVDKRVVYSHDKFVEPMLEYILNDFVKSRIAFADKTIGAMVVCDSSDQAKKMYEIFDNKKTAIANNDKDNPVAQSIKDYKMVAEPLIEYNSVNLIKENNIKASLILHDIGTKDDRKHAVEDFKDGKIDILFVYNMLLTGFDAKRLKKLYMGRIVKDHNLLQTLTRVNRPYKEFRYGFVVDFADIRKEFDATNKAYFEELQDDLGDEMDNYSNLFMTKEEIEEAIVDIKEKLFHFDLTNAEIFSRQITQIQDKNKVLEIKKALGNARNLFNVIRLIGHFDLLEDTDFNKLRELYYEVARHLDMINLKENLENKVDTSNLLNVAMENVIFMFRKISEEEMVISDKLKDILKRTRETMAMNFDPLDPEFVSLHDELMKLFKKKNLDEITQEEMIENISALQQILDKVTELNRKNNLLRAKYENDAKYARIHKRLVGRGKVTDKESQLHDLLLHIKTQADDKVLINSKMLDNENYFNKLMMKLVVDSFDNKNIILEPESAKYINGLVVREYVNEYNGHSLW